VESKGISGQESNWVFGVRRLASTPNCKPLGQEARQTCFGNLLLHGREIIFYAKLLDEIVLRVVNAVRCAPVSIARLADTTHVDEILFGWFDANVLDSFPANIFIPNKYHRHMCVPEETDGGVLVGETRGCIEVIKNVAPLPRRIERCVYDGKIVHTCLQR